MKWVVRYYNGSLPLQEISSEDMDYNDLPKKNVVEVFVQHEKYSHTMRGMDFYWIHENFYGMFNRTGEEAKIEEQNRLEAGHEQIIYEGKNCVKWEWSDQGHLFFEDQGPPDDIHILEGIMIPDDQAKEIGIL